jgi:hypothetical protein
MKKQIKDIDGPLQYAVFEHQQFFNHMRHGIKRGEQHQDRNRDNNGIWNFVDKLNHFSGPPLSCSPVRHTLDMNAVRFLGFAFTPYIPMEKISG